MLYLFHNRELLLRFDNVKLFLTFIEWVVSSTNNNSDADFLSRKKF